MDTSDLVQLAVIHAYAITLAPLGMLHEIMGCSFLFPSIAVILEQIHLCVIRMIFSELQRLFRSKSNLAYPNDDPLNPAFISACLCCSSFLQWLEWRCGLFLVSRNCNTFGQCVWALQKILELPCSVAFWDTSLLCFLLLNNIAYTSCTHL